MHHALTLALAALLALGAATNVTLSVYKNEGCSGKPSELHSYVEGECTANDDGQGIKISCTSQSVFGLFAAEVVVDFYGDKQCSSSKLFGRQVHDSGACFENDETPPGSTMFACAGGGGGGGFSQSWNWPFTSMVGAILLGLCTFSLCQCGVRGGDGRRAAARSRRQAARLARDLDASLLAVGAAGSDDAYPVVTGTLAAGDAGDAGGAAGELALASAVDVENRPSMQQITVSIMADANVPGPRKRSRMMQLFRQHGYMGAGAVCAEHASTVAAPAQPAADAAGADADAAAATPPDANEPMLVVQAEAAPEEAEAAEEEPEADSDAEHAGGDAGPGTSEGEVSGAAPAADDEAV